MRRVILFLMAVAILMALVVAPALASPPTNKPGQYTCFKIIGQQQVTFNNVPQGQTALYDFCFPHTNG